MSTVYLVRHGQAGTRDFYDSLSELGREQARLLGEYFLSQRLEFQRVISGGLQRQRQTADAVAQAYANAGAAFPSIEINTGWDEFDLTRVYREIAPQLCREDAEFASQYKAMNEQIRADAGSATAAVHRQWQPCDSKVVQAWISGRFSQQGETWHQFHERIAARVHEIRGLPDESHVAIFTSATPTGIWSGLAMDIFDERSIRLAGVVQNSSFSVFRLRQDALRLFTFNATPHLPDARLRTHR